MAKARVEKSKYNPITLVLDTEEEAKALWHALNVSQFSTLTDYTKVNGIDIDMLKDCISNIFAVLDNFYTPDGYG